jgi:hypothetical protein
MKLSTSLNNYQEYLNTETNYEQLFNDFLCSDMVKELYEEKKPEMKFNMWKSQMKKRRESKINQKRLNVWVEMRRGELNEKFNELARNQELNEIRIEKGEAERLRRQMEKMKEDYEAQIENMKALHENKVKCLEGTISNLRKTNFRNINTIKKLKERKVETIIEETIEEVPVEETIIEVEEPEPEPEKVIIDSSDDEPPLDLDEIEFLKMYNQPKPVENEFLDSDKIEKFFENNTFKEKFYEDYEEGELSYKEIVNLIKKDFIEKVGEPIKDSCKRIMKNEIKWALEDIEIYP